MKKSLVWVIGAVVLCSGAMAFAQDAKAPGASSPAAAAPMMAQMDEHMKKMQALHDRMMSAATPEERQKAMEEAARKCSKA